MICGANVNFDSLLASTTSLETDLLSGMAKDALELKTELEAKLTKQEEAKMIEEGKKDELIEKYQSENEALAANSEKWAKYEEGKRASLIEQHPEEDRESLANLPLDTLEYVTNKINNSKSNAPEVAGNPRKVIPTKDYTDMTQKEKREHHEAIIKRYQP